MFKEGLNGTQISKQLEIPRTTVYSWIKGQRKPLSAWSEEELSDLNERKTVKIKNYWLGKEGHMKGKKFSEEHKRNLAKSKWGDKNPKWKGDAATPNAGRGRARRLIGPQDGKDIHHIDGNPLNNEPDNLEPLTRQEHMEKDGRLENQCPKCNKFSTNNNYCVSCGQTFKGEAHEK